MKLREYAAGLTGAMTFFATMAAQWIMTDRPIEDILFLAVLAYFIGIGVVLAVTEPRRKQPRRKHRARPIDQPEPGHPVTVTLNEEEW
ncbi:MAG: hypothetical protein LUI87_02130 [Lachnospiraceae bacterium]|nr:hypothetical protein [Lachnospiraceae bacterium]